ncbi:glycosyltransferase [Candidatus Parcubacteria bacterium]|jgi:glycosyltransferase involved in cell wall biosynthesis|nr:glycosyltransferase [Candidatus Parcubacteria bacterium]
MTNKKQLKGKKILLLVTQTKWGGAQKYVLELAKYLKKHNEVHIAFGEVNKQNQKFIDSCKELKVKTIPLPKLVRNIEIIKDFSAIASVSGLLSKESYDLIHLNSSKVGLLGTLGAMMFSLNPMNIKPRVVYTAHGFVFNEPGSKVQRKLYKFSEQFSTSLQSLIIAVSDFDRQSALDNNICDPRKIFSVHNGINAEDYDFYDRQTARQKLDLSNNKKYFGTIASFYNTKGHQYLIEAIKQLRENKSLLVRNHQWLLIGEGIELFDIKKLIEKYQLEDLIKIIKPKDNDWKYLQAFDYFILPSVKEGLPYTILEAGLAKIPIIASKVGGIPEVLSNEKTGLLTTPANPVSLVNAMRRLSKDQNLANQLADNNYKNVKENFSLSKTLKETEDLYLKLF